MQTSVTANEVEQDIGAVVDRRYVIKRPIFRGEVHDVFEAEHGWTQVRVALKVLCEPRTASVASRARLLREARVLGICRHPGLPMVMDAGQCDQYGPYVVTELIEGKGLHSLMLTRGRIDVGTTLAIAAQVADALDHVHKRGIVHRDLKPSNLLVMPSRGTAGERVRLIDFGVAAVPLDDDVSQAKITQHGQILGTRAYMSPEQLLGLDGVDGRSDIYALAVIVYECLTGELPFPTSASEWMQAFANGMQPAPMKIEGVGVSASAETVIRSALIVDPLKRPRTAGEFVQKLADAVGGSIPVLRLYEGATAAPLPDASAMPSSAPDTTVPVEQRRRFVRAPYTSPARIVRADGSFADGQIEDVSEGGMLLVADSPCTPGETVTLKVPLPVSGRVVQLEAITRWGRRRTGRMATGLEFVNAPEEALADIRRYVELMSS